MYNRETHYSRNFPKWEMHKSQTASRLGIDNTPGPEAEENLRLLAQYVLQPIRDYFGVVNVNSGFRSPQVNTIIGGSPTSHHCLGYAADIELAGADLSNYALATWIRNNLEFDQLILEYPGPHPRDGWVHVSYIHGDNRNMVMTKDRSGYKNGLIPHEDNKQG